MLKNIFLSLILVLSFPVGAQSAGLECLENFKAPQELFGYVEDQSWGKQIYLHEFASIRDQFTRLLGQSWQEIESQLILNDTRKNFFHLRVLSQSYLSLDPSFFKNEVQKFKNIEYLLGRVALYRDLKTTVQSMNEPILLDYFEKQRQASSSDLKQAFDELGFIDAPLKAFNHLKKKYEKYDQWPSSKKDRKFLLDETIEFARDLKDKIDKKAFDKNDLDQGLHKLRRVIRELTYRLVNLQHLSVLVDEGELPPLLSDWYDELKKVNPNILTSPYMPDSVSEVKNPIQFPQKLNAMITEVITLIGEDKDQQEPLIYIKAAVKDVKNLDEASKRRILDKVKERASQLEDQKEIADSFQARLDQTKLLHYYIHFLEHHN